MKHTLHKMNPPKRRLLSHTRNDTLSNCFLSFPCYNPTALALFLAVAVFHATETVAINNAPVQHSGNQSDYMALLAIKGDLVDHNASALSSWNHSLHHCSWEGVTCERIHKHYRVTDLVLESQGLRGTISPFIGNLSFLQDISLRNNSLYGTIPPEIGYLSNLQFLDLCNNTLTGNIPSNVSSLIKLLDFYVSSNQLQGEIPIGLGVLPLLGELNLDNNQFTGALFKVLANISSLESISAINNAFRETIPDSICRLSKIYTLSVNGNGFFGRYPDCMFNITSLQCLDLGENELEGQLPADIHLKLPHLISLNLVNNSFSGTVPSSLFNLTSLTWLHLGGNNFTGRISPDFRNFRNLTHINLASNYLEGDIGFIHSLANCSKLQFLQLDDNLFTGTFTKSIANLSVTLRYLTLGNNPTSGAIPSGITNLINLIMLDMRANGLTGPIPSDIGKLRHITYINFEMNKLTGSIPNSFGNLSQLSTLTLSRNKLEGRLPPSLGSCTSLLYLYLDSNILSHTLPNELFLGSAKFVMLNLSQNHLEGSLSFGITEQTELTLLDVSENKLTGIIPDEIDSCTELKSLFLAGNTLHGSIPQSFKTLGSLQAVDLSRNNLSGTIPTFMSTFPLFYLNLSHNNFEGKVPTKGVFANVSAIDLVGNSRLCGGIPMLHLPYCVEKRKKKKVFPVALKAIIAILSALFLALAITIGLYLMSIRRKRKSPSPSSAVGSTFFNVSYNMLLKATNEFSSENLLGAGNFGFVYKGIFSKQTFAVKVLNLKSKGASKSFMAECNALRNIRHRNLLPIITACSSIDFQGNNFKALVFEFMPNGSLDRWLHHARNLTLCQRVDIAIDVAHALNYLHHECEIPIVHCDLKPSNILLDNEMVAHVGDFGLAKFLAQPQHLNQSSSIGVKGTIGYAPPEYGLAGEVSISGDVYSYGIMLLELMTGKSPTDDQFKEDQNLHMFAEEALPDHVMEIIDPALESYELSEEEMDKGELEALFQRRIECMVSVVTVGVDCSNHQPQDRMNITDVVRKLVKARECLVGSKDRQNSVGSRNSGISVVVKSNSE